jgi:cyclohexa-1,5-dienecarbonyl-CoA hydratase
MSDPSDPVLVHRNGRAATLVLNRSPLNILDIPTIECLGEAVAGLAADPELQVVVVRGGGDRAFSAGVSVQDHTPDKVESMLAGFHRAIRGLLDLDAVTVAAVHGHCLGGGMELAMACDVVIATEETRFGQPEIELGCYPPVAAALYPRRFGYGLTVDLLITGRSLSCEDAARLGLVARRVPTFGLEQEVQRFVAEVTAKSAAVTRLTKRAIRAGRDQDFGAALTAAEHLYLQELCPTADMQEGIAAFLEKRRPVWKHQ